MKKQHEELERDLFKVKACDILRLKLASDKIKDANKARLAGSGVVLEVKTLAGVSITGAFAIFDGLSDATIDAIIADIERTFMLRLDLNTPSGLRQSVKIMYQNKE